MRCETWFAGTPQRRITSSLESDVTPCENAQSDNSEAETEPARIALTK